MIICLLVGFPLIVSISGAAPPQLRCVNSCASSLSDEGLCGEGAAATVGGDGAASRGAAHAGDGEGSSVAGGGEAGGHPAAPPAAQGPGQLKQLRLKDRCSLKKKTTKENTQERLLYF